MSESTETTTLMSELSARRAPGAGEPDGSHVLAPTDESPWFVLGVLVLAAVSLRGLLLLLGPGFAVEFAAVPESAGLLSAAGETAAAWGRGEAGGWSDLRLYGLALAAVLLVDGPLLGWLGVQALAGGAAVVLAYFVGQAVLGQRLAGFVAAGVVAAHPAVVGGSAALVADMWVMLLVLGGLWWVARSGTEVFGRAMGAGVCFAAGGLIHPPAALAGLVAAGWLIARERSYVGLGAGLTMAVLSVATVLALGLSVMSGAYGPSFAASGGWSDGFALLAAPQVERMYHLLGLGETGVSVEPGVAILVGLSQGRLMPGGIDPVAYGLGVGWLVLDVALLAGAVAGLGLLLWRGYWGPAWVGGGLLLAWLVSLGWWDASVLRPAAVLAQALLIGGLLLPAPAREPRWKRRQKDREPEEEPEEAVVESQIRRNPYERPF